MYGYLPFVLALGLWVVSGCMISPIVPLKSAKLEDVFDLPKLQSIEGAITKVVGTTTAVLLLLERSNLSIDDPLQQTPS